MRAVVVVVAVSTIVGAVAYVLSETAAGFRSRASVALEENVPSEELDAAREPLRRSLPTVLAAIEADTSREILGDDVEVELETPERVSRVDVLVTAPDALKAQSAAQRVADEMQRLFTDERRAEAQTALASAAEALEQQRVERARQQDLVDLAIADEAFAAAEVQRAILAGVSEDAVRAEMDEAADRVRTAAAVRDDIADVENRIHAQLLKTEIDVALTDDAAFVVPASSAENVTGRPLRNAVEAALIAAVTLLTAWSILQLGRRAP